jgi:hypothetical protein
MSPLPPYGMDNHVHKRRKKLIQATIEVLLHFVGVDCLVVIPSLSMIRKTSEKQKKNGIAQDEN